MEETLAQMIKRIMSTPVDRNEPYVFRYYQDGQQPNKPALWVVLGGKRYGSACIVAHGRNDLGWRNADSIGEHFRRHKAEMDVHDGDLLTETEARELADSIGLDINVAKAEMVNDFTEYNKYSPNIVADDEKALLAHREEMREIAKKSGWGW